MIKDEKLTRRDFIKFTGLSAALATAPKLTFMDLAKAAQFNPLPQGTPILVVVTLYGGNDGLNTVIPADDPTYQSSRPGLALSAAESLSLGDSLYLNGAMTGMKNIWDQNKLAIIRGVGYPNPDRSHFSSMAIWQSASPTDHLSSGWIGRWLDNQAPDPLKVISIGSTPSPLVAGDKYVGSVLPLNGFNIPKGTFGSELLEMGSSADFQNPLLSRAAGTIQDLFTLGDDLSATLKNPAPPVDPTITALTQAGASFGADASLSQQLDLVAKLININVPTKVWSVSLGGFDTHADELQSQNGLLKVLSDSISRFFSQIQNISRANDVVVMVYSEFGRRVHANASQGTDHGTAAPVFILGNKVKGGFYGEQPSLTNLNQGDLWATVDFRDVYAGLIEQVLNNPADQIIPNWKSDLKVM
jgi:uncharacterized protein (DUF1501 family)